MVTTINDNFDFDKFILGASVWEEEWSSQADANAKGGGGIIYDDEASEKKHGVTKVGYADCGWISQSALYPKEAPMWGGQSAHPPNSWTFEPRNG